MKQRLTANLLTYGDDYVTCFDIHIKDERGYTVEEIAVGCDPEQEDWKTARGDLMTTMENNKELFEIIPDQDLLGLIERKMWYYGLD